MRISPRFVLAAASVLAFVAADVLSLALGPALHRSWLVFPAVIAIGLSVSSVVAEPRELLAALVFGVTPVMRLVGSDSFQWLIGPMAVLLLVACELNAWSWELAAHDVVNRGRWRRLASIAGLAIVGLVASLGISFVARFSLLDGVAAVALAAAALAGLGRLVLPPARAWISRD